MRPKRIARLGLPALALLVLAVEPVAAQSSLNEELIQGLNQKLLYVAIPITILVELILLYVVLEFKDNDDPKPTRENRRLEITWTVATAIILLFVGFASYQVLAVPAIGGVDAASPSPQAGTGGGSGQAAVSHDAPGAVAPPQDSNALEVEVVAAKYFWTFNYTEQNVSSSGTLVIPANRTIYLHVISEDWLHAVHVPDLALKQDAFPGQYNTIQTEVYETGTYQLYCAEYCGVGHSNMLGKVRVVSQSEFQQWLDKKQSQKSGNQTATPQGNQTGGQQNGTTTPSGNQTATPGGNQTATQNGTATGA